MSSRNTTDLKVGITVLAGIAILIFGIMWAKGIHIGAHPVSLVARFPTAGGAERGDPVFVRGLRRGTITGVTPNERGEIIITMELTEKVPLQKNAKAAIMMLELMGGKKIEIDPGNSQEMLDPARDTIAGWAAGDLSSLVAMGNSLSGSVESIGSKADSLLTSLNALFSDPKFRDDIRGGINEARMAMRDASAALKSVQSVVNENRETLRTTINDLHSLAEKLNSTIDDLTPQAKATLEDARKFVARANEVMTKADSSLAFIQQMLDDGKKNKALLYRLMTDKEFGQKVDSTLMNASKMIWEIRHQGLNTNIRMFQGAEPIP